MSGDLAGRRLRDMLPSQKPRNAGAVGRKGPETWKGDARLAVRREGRLGRGRDDGGSQQSFTAEAAPEQRSADAEKGSARSVRAS